MWQLSFMTNRENLLVLFELDTWFIIDSVVNL